MKEGEDIDFAEPTSKKYHVRVRTSHGEYEGLLFSPYPTRRLSEALSKIEDFINLKDARDITSKERYPFIVISKRFIETIKVLDER